MAGIEQAPPMALEETEKSSPEITMGVPESSRLEQGKVNKDDVEGKEILDEAFLVTFSPDDSDDPKNWSKKIKWGVTLALSATGFNRIMISTVRLSDQSNAIDPVLYVTRQ